MTLENEGAARNALSDNYFDLGLRLLEAGEFEEAVAMFDSAVKLGLGDLASVYLCRADALSALGRWDAAERSINQALEIEPYLAAAYNERGKIRLARRENEAASNDFTMAIHIEPDYVAAHLNRALAHEARRRYAEAEADLTRALKLNPELKAAYEIRGRVRAAQFKFDEAIADLSYYLRSGGGRDYDNHSETQGYLLILRVQRLLWRLIPRWGQAGLGLRVRRDVVAPDGKELAFEKLKAFEQEAFKIVLGLAGSGSSRSGHSNSSDVIITKLLLLPPRLLISPRRR